MGLDLGNAAQLQAVQSLTAAQAQLDLGQRRVASGLKVASAKDDGASWQIAQSLRAQAAGWSAVGDSIARGQSILDVAANAAERICDLLNEVKAKAIALTGAGDAASEAALQNDIQAVIAEIDTAARSAAFGGVNLVDRPSAIGGLVALQAPAPVYQSPSLGSFQTWNPNLPDEVGTFDFTFAGAPNEAYSVNVINLDQGTDQFQGNVNPPPVSALSFPQTPVDSSTWLLVQTFPGTSLTGASFTPTAPPPPVSVLSDPSGGKQALDSYDLTAAGLGLGSLSWGNPASLVASVETARQAALAAAQGLGSQQRLLSDDAAQANQHVDVLGVAVGHMVDADLGKESALLQASQVKRQLASQALSIANAAPKALLSLFR